MNGEGEAVYQAAKTEAKDIPSVANANVIVLQCEDMNGAE